MRDTRREREAETQAEKKQAPRREPGVGLDPRTRGHALSQRQTLNCRAPQAPQNRFVLFSPKPFLKSSFFLQCASEPLFEPQSVWQFVNPHWRDSARKRSKVTPVSSPGVEYMALALCFPTYIWKVLVETGSQTGCF